ncbi:poly-beta-1,6 N-acetyl-D-glucosamine synthase [Lacibacter cauensis]|uniref:Poly-beta-1,6 N-acetyl-D-glucosamine synthase n=1 Tax=Lacibacter cauensis TaxID=510947 RepID=A0A562SWS9_9BACT|nr:glycosyltransferase [Lacibacter cauensis]TWI85488.1 poly-beta-1,6 N-acetyl-D-glucosamine synthase [Lacibacter cauensis]
MSQTKQVFETRSTFRWKAVLWTSRGAMFIVLLMICSLIISYLLQKKPALPELSSQSAEHKLIKPSAPAGLTKKELQKYKGFDAFLKAKEYNEQLMREPAATSQENIRAAFYVDWDPQSFYSLQKNISNLNMVFPEWFFIDPVTDTLRPSIDYSALKLMQQAHVKIIPLINNTNDQKGEGVFDGDLLHRILTDRKKRERLINDIVKYCRQYNLQGINIDFEEYKEVSDMIAVSFQKELYSKLHKLGLLVTQDIMPDNNDFNLSLLATYNDYLVLMAYDEHYSSSVPGAVSSQRWIEKMLDKTAAEVSPQKIILGIAGYGYDWKEQQEAATITYQQALATAKQYNAVIDFNNDTYNNEYSYTDADNQPHKVYFTDAATNFNTLRFADEYKTAGTALWRLGSEDERLWKFYGRNLDDAALKLHPFDIKQLAFVAAATEHPDYVGDGEVLNVITTPQPGKIKLEADSAEGIIAEQQYVQLPTRYVIRKYGNVHNQVVLTFDDGPDPLYTPQIIDILKKEKVPAAFFVVGLQAENNLPLLKQLAADGYEIGNHTFTHPNIAEVSTERAVAEMEATRLLIEAVTGRSTVLFRPPFNADAEPTKEVELKPIAISKQKSYYAVGESIDPNDWEDHITADSIYNRVIHQYEANPEKGIILLHDAGGNRQATVDALPRIIHYFKKRGVAFTSIASLLHTNHDQLMPSVQSGLIQIDNRVAGAGYWLQRILTGAFWLAIILGIVKIVMMGVMAILKRKQEEKSPVDVDSKQYPPVSIIVPAYNEEVNAVRTINNLLLQDYPHFKIVFIDDGSKDSTLQRVTEAFQHNEKVTILTKENGGKASALNKGIRFAESEYVVCIDADTQLKTDALLHLMKPFTTQKTVGAAKTIGAVAGNVRVGNQHTLLTKWQSIEYTTAQNFDRRALDLINGITVVPGAIGAFSKEAIELAGGFTTDTLAEDCDLTIRILRKGYRVVNCTTAIAITEAPETLNQFMKQRFRWSYGIMQAFWKNRDACFRPKYKGLGLMALPNILLFQILLPVLAPLADLMLLISLIWNRHDTNSLGKIGTFYLLFLLIDVVVGAIAFAFEKEKMSKLVWLIPQRLVYRQLMYIILFRAIKKAIKGESQQWGVLKRTGHVAAVTAAT